MSYLIKEIFYSLQGEGLRSGEASVFVRFANCNLACSWCDTDFVGGTEMTAEEIRAEVEKYPAEWIVFTGGEPGLQLDAALLGVLGGYSFAVETNGTVALPEGCDWVCVSPKGAPLKQAYAHEVKFVLHAGEKPGDSYPSAKVRWVSPVHEAPGALEWCIAWCLEHPEWRLSTQSHKTWGVE